MNAEATPDGGFDLPIDKYTKPKPVDDDRCSKCGGELDTGYECNDCGHDARPELDA